MSLITRCPACETMFKVVADQLRISEGWVRCGQCGQVFNASAHLVQDTAATEAPPAAQDQPLAAALSRAMPMDAPATVAERPASRSWGDEPAPTPTEAATPAVAVAMPDAQPPAQLAQPEPGPDPAPKRTATAPVATRAVAMAEDEDAITHKDLSFVRQGLRRAFWQRPLVRATLVLGGLVLALLLAAQVTVQERDRFAVLEPRARPLLQALCDALGCTVGPLRQIDAVVIDGSSFNRVRGDTYRLGLTVRNQAALPIAMPAIELTLTDGQDQPVLRRVLTPSELGAASDELAANGEWSGTLALSVASGVGRVAGYRVLAFYP